MDTFEINAAGPDIQGSALNGELVSHLNNNKGDL